MMLMTKATFLVSLVWPIQLLCNRPITDGAHIISFDVRPQGFPVGGLLERVSDPAQ